MSHSKWLAPREWPWPTNVQTKGSCKSLNHRVEYLSEFSSFAAAPTIKSLLLLRMLVCSSSLFFYYLRLASSSSSSSDLDLISLQAAREIEMDLLEGDVELQEIQRLEGHMDRVWGLAWNPVYPMLASCSGDKTVRVWQQNPGKKTDSWECKVWSRFHWFLLLVRIWSSLIL